MQIVSVAPWMFERFLKWLSFVFAGVILTCALLLLMVRWVAFNDKPVEDEGGPAPVVAVFDTPPPVEEKYSRPKQPEEIIPPPVIERAINPTTTLTSVIDVLVTLPPPPIIDGEFGIDFSTGAPVKRLSASPVYPRNALSRGIEGFVDVQYFVSPIGYTESVTVIRAEPKGYFEGSALSAVEKWKFQPKEVEGAKSFGPIVERIRFTIEK